MNGLNDLLDRLERLIGRYLEQVRAGAKADVLMQLMGQIIALIVEITHSPIGDAARQQFALILRRLMQDPNLTQRGTEYLRTRILALEEAADQFIILAAKADDLRGSRDHDLPSPAERFQDRFVAQISFFKHLLEETAQEVGAIEQLIPSTDSVIDASMPRQFVSHAPVSPQLAVPGKIPAVPTPAAQLMRVTPHVHLTRKGKAEHLAAESRAFGTHLLETLQQHRTPIDRAGTFGVSDPAVLRAVAKSLRDTIARILASCKDLLALANGHVGIVAKFGRG